MNEARHLLLKTVSRDWATVMRKGRSCRVRIVPWLCGLLVVALLCRAMMAQSTSVLTYHNDNLRTGQNTQETILTPANVNGTQFGKLFSQSVDGAIHAQPLYVPNLTISGGTHNVVFVVTEADSVYAFDADNNGGSDASPLWSKSMLDTAHGAASGATPAEGSEGITSTPVIDLSTNTMYALAKSSEGGGLVFRLHALDIFTGNEKSPGPVRIAGFAYGFGDGGSIVTFNEQNQFNRPGLLLVNGTIYIAFASDQDDFAKGQYYGWVFAYDAATFTQTGVLATTPNALFNAMTSTGAGGGIWMSGAGLAADASGNVYATTGNGAFNGGINNFGDCILKIGFSSGNLVVTDYFTPFNTNDLNSQDRDLGSGGVLLLPDGVGSTSHPHLLVQAGKGGSPDFNPTTFAPIHVIDRDQMTTGNQHFCSGCTSDTNIVQELSGAVAGMWSMPSYWNGKVYLWGTNDVMRAFTVSNGLLSTSPSFTSANSYHLGATMSVSANATSNGIVWALEVIDSPPSGSPSLVLHAYDATNGTQLYQSSDNDSRDDPGSGLHFLVPTVANGKTYVGTGQQLSVYGLLPIALTVNITGSGSVNLQGTLNGASQNINCAAASCTNSFDANSQVTLNASPAAGYSFSGWSGAGCSGTGTCTVTLSSAQTVTAVFSRNTLTVNINGSGSVGESGTFNAAPVNYTCTSSNCQHDFDYNTPVTLTGTGAAGYNLIGWTGCDSVDMLLRCHVTMNHARTVTADIAPQLTINIAGSGTVAANGINNGISSNVTCSASTCVYNFDFNTGVYLTASPGAGYSFIGWVGCDSTYFTYCTVTMSSPRTITAKFASIAVTSPTSGQVLSAGNSLTVSWTVPQNWLLAGDTFRIDLLRGGQESAVITSGVAANAGTYTWSIPAGQALSKDYQVFITDLNNPVTGASGSFEILSTATSAIALTSVNSGIAPRTHDKTITITWVYTGAVGTNVTLQLYKENTLLPTAITGTGCTSIGTGGNGSCVWTPAADLQIGSGYSIKVTASSGATDRSHAFVVVR